MSKFSSGNMKAGKLSAEQVFELRQRVLVEGWTQAQASRYYKLHINTVGRICRGESYQKVPTPTDHTSVQERLLALQEAMNADPLERMKRDIATAIKPELQLAQLKGDKT